MKSARATFGKLTITAILAALALLRPATAAAGTVEAAAFVADLGKQAQVAMAKTETGPAKQRREALRDLIRKGFNLKRTSQFVLGKTWNHATEPQRAEFQEVFAEYLVNTYARHLASFDVATLQVVDSNPVGAQDVLVETTVDGRDGPAKPVWRVHATDGQQYKVIDVTVDGVSLALTQRREFASVVNRVGIDGLIRILREKLADQADSAYLMPQPEGMHGALLTQMLTSPNTPGFNLFLAAGR